MIIKRMTIRDNLEMEAMKMCYGQALSSPDPSTQNAAVLCHPDGRYIWATRSRNEFPSGVVSTAARWERPMKYSLVEHAERNSIYTAARLGIATDGLTMVCPWAACADCARGIIQAGIRRLVTHSPEDVPRSDHWDISIDTAMTMLDEAGVTVEYIFGPIGGLPPILRNGELFTP